LRGTPRGGRRGRESRGLPTQRDTLDARKPRSWFSCFGAA
jgi:hypothetical protein